MEYEAIIGLEIHVQLKTKSKMFCSCPNDGENKPPNTTICPICLGHPGVLPVPNKQAILFAIKAGLALNCEIAPSTKFDRKNYFYPDLPKAYQISQYDEPIAKNGFIEIIFNEKTSKKFRITRLHLEEDAAKNIHTQNNVLIDFNRSGTPLIEIVTEPDFRTPEQAKLFLQELRAIMRYLKISDADMEKGHLRCDANISLRPKGNVQLYPKTEIKNLNSFKSVQRALEFEIKRQTKLWEQGNPPKKNTTRGWDEDKQITVEQRSKEDAEDYRYFPEPDIPRININQKFIQQAKTQIPELPLAKRQRFYSQYSIPFYRLNQLVLDQNLSEYFENVISELENWIEDLSVRKKKKDFSWEKDKESLIRLTVNWLLDKLPHILEKLEIDFENLRITPENFAELLSLLYKKAINKQTALKILEKMADPKFDDQDPSHIMERFGLAQIDNKAELEKLVQKIIQENPKQVEQFKQGKQEILNYLLGQVMKQSQGKANPILVKEILLEYLS